MPNVMITQRGLDFVMSANDKGPMIWLDLFVPVYDDRIDNNVRTSGYTLSSFADIVDVTRTTPYGEIIWNRTGYSVDYSSNYVISAVSANGGFLQNSYQKATTYTNLYNGNPLSDQVSASFWASSAVGDTGLYNWNAPGGAVGVTANNPVGNYWSAGDYYPVYEGPQNNELRGSIKCQIDKNRGNFKFNKIALYAKQDQTSEICFFGEAYLEVPAVVSNLEVGFDQFEFDIQIDISGVSATWAEVFFSSSADYWSHSPGGLYFPNRIGVGQFDGSVPEISATMHLRYARDDLDTGIPILRMDYDNNRFISIDVDGNRYDVTTLYSGYLSGTDVIINVANWNRYCGNAISIHPNAKSTVALGTSTKPFRELYLENAELEDDNGKNTNSIIPLNVINSKSNYAASFNNGSIYLGIHPTYATDVNYFGIRLSANGVLINDNLESLSNNGLLGNFKGGDLWREGQNLLVYNTWCSNRTAPNQGVENLYIFAGLDGDATYTSIYGQDGATHKNIVYEIEKSTTASPLFCGKNTNLATTSELHLAAKGKIALHGPIEIQNLSEYADTAALANAILISRANEKRMLIGAGIKDATTFDTLTDRMASTESDTETPIQFTDLFETNSRLFLIAEKIFVNSDIVPLNPNNNEILYNIGKAKSRFCTGYFNHIEVGTTDTNPQKGLWLGKFDGAYGETGVNYGLIQLGIAAGDTVSQIGQRGDPISYGFFNSLYAKGYSIGEIETISFSDINSGVFSFTGNKLSSVTFNYFNVGNCRIVRMFLSCNFVSPNIDWFDLGDSILDNWSSLDGQDFIGNINFYPLPISDINNVPPSIVTNNGYLFKSNFNMGGAPTPTKHFWIKMYGISSSYYGYIDFIVKNN